MRTRLLVALALCLGLWGGLEAFSSRYRIAVDRQPTRCLPWSVYLVDLGERDPHRFDLFAFTTRAAGPFADGTVFAKFIAGVPGDLFVVSRRETTIGGVSWGPLREDYATALHRSVESLERREQIPSGRYAVLTQSSASFDSRYWGTIAHDQIQGRAIPLW